MKPSRTRPAPHATRGLSRLNAMAHDLRLYSTPSQDSQNPLLGWGKRYLMCSPDHFDVTYSINPWMDTRTPVDKTLARRQWEQIVGALQEAGATVEVIAQEKGLPDMVFVANAGLAVGDTFIPARMHHKERRGETTYFTHWFEDRGYKIHTLPEGIFQEGIGDALPFAGTLVSGWWTRSSPESCEALGKAAGASVLPIEICNPRFYHIDLSFCPLDSKHAILAPSAWSKDAFHALKSLVPEPLVLTPGETETFCANSIVVDRTIIMPACPVRVRHQLEAWGFEPIVIPVTEFIKAGGGIRCLTLPLDVPQETLREESALPVITHKTEKAEEDTAALEEEFSAHNYHPLPIVIARAAGSWVYDPEGHPYLDMLSAYSALNFGHRHPRLIAAAERQLSRVTLTSRAFMNDQLGPFCRDLTVLCDKDLALCMNTGAEAVETAIKSARKWGYMVKGVEQNEAKIVVCEGNFHGRTTTIVGFSSDPAARNGFGPFTPGFLSVPYGDTEALKYALDIKNVVAFLVEPIQGEAGVVIPPAGYLQKAAEMCRERNVLLLADEIQSGLGRTGYTFACDYEGVQPDVYILGKALGGGIMPLSAVVASNEVLGVFHPGEHGSTFGGNPLACALGREVISLLNEGEVQERSARLGEWLLSRLKEASLPGVTALRGRGLWLALDIDPEMASARSVCERLLKEGALAKETHERTVRLAPPLIVSKTDLEWALSALERSLHFFAG